MGISFFFAGCEFWRRTSYDGRIAGGISCSGKIAGNEWLRDKTERFSSFSQPKWGENAETDMTAIPFWGEKHEKRHV